MSLAHGCHRGAIISSAPESRVILLRPVNSSLTIQFVTTVLWIAEFKMVLQWCQKMVWKSQLIYSSPVLIYTLFDIRQTCVLKSKKDDLSDRAAECSRRHHSSRIIEGIGDWILHSLLTKTPYFSCSPSHPVPTLEYFFERWYKIHTCCGIWLPQ